jgi:transcriptional regulator with XRE-family HTH domain
MNPKKARTSVSQMVRETSEDSSFKELFEDRLRARRIVKDLMIQRAVLDLSQKEIADRIGCTQSRISKLESTHDADLRLGDLAKYADALGLRVNIVLESKEWTPVTRIKKFAFQIKHELDRLATLAAQDHLIAKGLSDFLGEAFFNLVNILQESAKKLPPRPEDGNPYVSFHICAENDLDSEEKERRLELADGGNTKALSSTPSC